MNTNTILRCSECGHQEGASSRPGLMNKIIMWNHVKKSHPRTADRLMRTFQTLPSDLYGAGSLDEVMA